MADLELLIFGIVSALLISYFALLLKPTAQFVVMIQNSKPRLTHGQVARGFLDLIEEMAVEHRVVLGEIRGVRNSGRIRLWFSNNLPGPFRQQVLNCWVNSK